MSERIYRLTSRAEADVKEIALYTAKQWGKQQWGRYFNDLQESFELLAERPGLGRPCNQIALNLRRFEVRHHVIFYREEPGGIMVARILHERMTTNRKF